jgi:Protein of unknown function (DUF4019)
MEKHDKVVTAFCVAAGLCVMAARGSGQGITPPDSATTSALAASSRWEALLAAADYSASWSEASKYFRDHVTQALWRGSAERLVIPRAASRTLLETRRDGGTSAQPEEHVLLRSKVSLGDGHELGERIVMIREADQQWRVGIYEQYPSVNGDILAPQGGARVAPPRALPRPSTVANPRKPA